MKHAFLVVALLGGATLLGPQVAGAASESDCTEMWKRADKDGDGSLRDAEAERYLAALRIRNLPLPTENRFNSDTFMQACLTDAFLVKAVDAGAPLKGESTLTEAQARDRAVAYGVVNLADMAQDADGIWRGKGMMDGKPVKIAVDYKGNVVLQ